MSSETSSFPVKTSDETTTLADNRVVKFVRKPKAEDLAEFKFLNYKNCKMINFVDLATESVAS